MKNNEIYGFYHVAAMNNWSDIVQEQVDLLYKTGLAHIATDMYAGVLGPCSQLKCQKLLRDIKIIDSNINLRLYEHFTLRYLKHFCRQRPNAKIFYLQNVFNRIK